MERKINYTIMTRYIDKDVLVAEIERLKGSLSPNFYEYDYDAAKVELLEKIEKFLNTLEVKEVKETMSIAYVVTRSEEHSDYVEKVFFDEDKAQKYCNQFKGNENEYARDITRVEVTL